MLGLVGCDPTRASAVLLRQIVARDRLAVEVDCEKLGGDQQPEIREIAGRHRVGERRRRQGTEARGGRDKRAAANRAPPQETGTAQAAA